MVYVAYVSWFAAGVVGCFGVWTVVSVLLEQRKRKRQLESGEFHFLTMHGDDGPYVTINCKTLEINLHGQTPPDAAKVFWNTVMSIVGRAPLFSDNPINPAQVSK